MRTGTVLLRPAAQQPWAANRTAFAPLPSDLAQDTVVEVAVDTTTLLNMATPGNVALTLYRDANGSPWVAATNLTSGIIAPVTVRWRAFQG
jgi:hypothetical protein